MAVKSFQELYDLFINELQSLRPDLTDTQIGSIIDVLSGTVNTAVEEINTITIEEFRKTFFDSADGPEITNGPDYLQTLAVDHFGSSFARPAASKSTGVVTFSRANTNAGNVQILAGTIVKTPAGANGTSVRFEVVSDVTMTGLSINASVRALLGGVEGNVQANTVTQIETTLTDPSVVVNNSAAFAGGAAALNDADYREYIRQLITTLQGATMKAVVARALTVAGVEMATGVEFSQYVKEWDIGGDAPIGDYFAIARARLYIADANGTASPTLIQDVKDAIETVRAAGVFIDVQAAAALALNWIASISLNPSGPNYGTLQSDPQMIIDEMRVYIQALPIGTSFSRASARTYILSKFGPSGTNDLTDFVTSSPSGDVTAAANQKIIPGTLDVV